MLNIPACGAVAQMGERLNGIQEAGGSIPPSSTNLKDEYRRSKVQDSKVQELRVYGKCKP